MCAVEPCHFRALSAQSWRLSGLPGATSVCEEDSPEPCADDGSLTCEPFGAGVLLTARGSTAILRRERDYSFLLPTLIAPSTPAMHLSGRRRRDLCVVLLCGVLGLLFRALWMQFSRLVYNV